MMAGTNYNENKVLKHSNSHKLEYIEKLIEWHKYPINAFLHLIALIILVMALWNHSWMWIIIAFVVALVGHLIQETYSHKDRIDKLEKKEDER